MLLFGGRSSYNKKVMMKTMTVFRFLLIMTLCGYAATCTAAPSRKPLSPLRITIVPTQAGLSSSQIKPGDVVEFTVTTVSSIDVQELSINIELLGGAKLISGETSWVGPAARNEAKSITLSVQAPEKGRGRVKARVSTPPSGGARFSAVSQFDLGPEVKSKPEQEPVIKKDRRGRSIIEYR